MCVVLCRLIPRALPTVFNDDSEMICRQFISEVNDDIDLSVDVSSHHVNSTAQDCGHFNADVEHCIETIGTDVGSLHFTLSLFASF